MPKLDLVTRWTKAVAAFKHMTEDEDFGPIYTKSFKIEYVEHERLLRDVEMAVQLNKADDVAKASATYEKVTKTFIGVLAKLQAKVGGKEMRVAVKKLTDEIDFLRKSTKDLGAKFEKAEPPAKEVNWKTVFTPDLLAKMTKLSMESGEYKRFAAEFNKVIKDCGIGSQATALPAEIWKQLVLHVVEPDEFAEKVGNSAKPQEAVLAEMGKALGTSVCKDAFDSAMKGLQPFSEHSERHLDRVIRETQRGSRWVFLVWNRRARGRHQGSRRRRAGRDDRQMVRRYVGFRRGERPQAPRIVGRRSRRSTSSARRNAIRGSASSAMSGLAPPATRARSPSSRSRPC